MVQDLYLGGGEDTPTSWPRRTGRGGGGDDGDRRDDVAIAAPATESILDVERATIRFGGLTAVGDVSFDVRPESCSR